MSFMKCIVLFLFFTASTSAVPHISGNVHRHRALAGRAASIDSADVPFIAPRKRGLSKRCKTRPNNSSVSSTASATTPAIVNAAPSPSIPSPKPETTTNETPQAAVATAAPNPAPQPAPSPPPPSSGGNQPSFMTGTQTGQGTFYGTGLGACGITNKDSDYIAAVSHLLFDQFPGYNGADPNNNPVCNRQIRATYQGKSVTITATDRCEACALTDLDFSPAAFNTIADPAQGRIFGMTWVWV